MGGCGPPGPNITSGTVKPKTPFVVLFYQNTTTMI